MRRCGLVALLALGLCSHAWAEPDHYAQAMRGRALATAGDCIACHTVPGGQQYAGGRALETPFGTIMTANLTPDIDTGLGRWSSADFARAMQLGLRPDGAHLYPAFPYPYFTHVSRADTDAIFAFLNTLPPVTNAVNRDTLPFPFDIRASLIAWNAINFTAGEYRPDPARSDLFNRGGYLVEGLGHCGACHTPMNAMGGSKGSQDLQGNQIQTWVAPNITNDLRAGIGGWSVDDIVEYLHSGRNAHSAASGPMAEVVRYSTALMPQDDLLGIATYLKERGAAGSAAPAQVSADDPRMRAGNAVYIDTCSACHASAGTGVDRLFPRLAGSAMVQQTDPTTLARVVITGVRAAVTEMAPTAPAMPSFGWRLSDSQVAAVLTYIRNSWGNAAPVVVASDVRVVRDKVVKPQEAAGGRP